MIVTKSTAGLLAAVAIAFLSSFAAVDSANAGHHGRCCVPACCPPPVRYVPQAICLYDPCTCCTTEAVVCVPACCCGEAPCVTWRCGIFGRRVAELSWKCCDFEADVVVTKKGRVIVRD